MRMSCKPGSWMQRLPWAVQSLAPCSQLGNIALTLGEKADGYSVQAACGLGSITVSGAKQASPYSANSKAANAVILDAALGDITLNFEE